MKPALLAAAAAVVGIAFLVPLVAGPPEVVVRSMSDDAFYYLGVARNVAEGRGPTYDTITRTTGFHPLWMFVLAARPSVSWALGLGTFLYVLTAFPVGAAAKNLWGTRGGWIAAILWLSNPHAVLLVATGMEGSLYAALLAGFVWSLTRIAQEPSPLRVLTAGVLAGSCVAARTDALLLVPLAAGWIAATAGGGLRGRFVRAAAFGSLALLPFALWIAWAHAWTGRWIQGSADTKTIWRASMNAEEGAVAITASLLVGWGIKAFVKVPALKWGIAFAFRPATSGLPKPGRALVHGLWLAPLLLGAAYALVLPKLWGWYFAPPLVTLTLLAAAGLDGWLVRREARLGAPAAARGLFAAAIVLIGVESVTYLTVKSIRGRNAYQEDMLAAASWMRDRLPPGTIAAAWNAGIYGWYSGHRVVNLDGLINNEIAERIRSGESEEEYLLRRGVEVLVDYDGTVESQLDSGWRERHLRPLFRRAAARPGGKAITVWEVAGP